MKGMNIGKIAVYFNSQPHILKIFDFSNYFILKIFKIEGQENFI